MCIRPKNFLKTDWLKKIEANIRQFYTTLIINNKEPMTRAEYIKAKFDEFVNDKELGEVLVGEKYYDAFELFDAYITNPRMSEVIDNKDYSLLAGFGSVSIAQLRNLGIELVDQIIGYIRDYINVDKLRVKD